MGRKADRFFLVHPKPWSPKTRWLTWISSPQTALSPSRVPVTSPPAPGGFGICWEAAQGCLRPPTSHLGSYLWKCVGCAGVYKRQGSPCRFLPSGGLEGGRHRLSQQRPACPRGFGTFHTQPPVLPNGGCTLVLPGPCGWGPNRGLLEDISRKGLGEGLSAWPPGASGG